MRASSLLLIAVLLIAAPISARADDTILAKGRIMASDGKTPLADASIAVYDEKGNVIAHGKTDAEGRYAMPVPKGALHLSKKRGGGFLGGLFKGAGGLVSMAAGMAPMALGGLGGLQGLAGSGSALAIGGLAAKMNPLSVLSGGGFNKAAMEAMRKRMAEEHGHDDDESDDLGFGGGFGAAPAANSPGAMAFRVTRSGHNEVGGIGQIYWMQDEQLETEGKKSQWTVAWVDPIWLAKAGEAAPSRIVRGYFAFEAGTVDPAIVEIGQSVILSVKLPLPDEPKVEVVVVARNAKTGAMWRLLPVDGGIFRAEIPVDDKFAKNDQTISVLAYARGSEPEGRSKRKEDELNKAGMWKLDKPFEYNPRIVASRNRVDLRLTVVEPPGK